MEKSGLTLGLNLENRVANEHRPWAEYVHRRLEEAGVKDLFSNREEGGGPVFDGTDSSYSHFHIYDKQIGIYNLYMSFEILTAKTPEELGRYREYILLDIGGNDVCMLSLYLNGETAKIDQQVGLMRYIVDGLTKDEEGLHEKGLYDAQEVVDKILELLTREENLKA